MTLTALLYPCLSVFAMASAVPSATTASAAVQEQAEPETGDRATGPVEMERAIIAEDGTMGPEPETLPETEPGIEVEPIGEPAELGAAAGPKPVFADLDDEAVFARVASYIEAIDTLETRFTQVAPSGNVTTGTMQLSRPGRLRFDYDAPNPTLIIANQGLVYVHDSDLETTDSYPVAKTPLKFLLAEQVDTSDVVLTGVNRGAEMVALTLESTDPETEGQLVLEFGAPELVLQRWAVFDPRGGVTVVELDALETGKRIANNQFRVPEAGGTFLRDR